MRRLLTLLVPFALAGCGGSSDSPSAPSVTVTGVYQLKTVNGSSLPYGTTSGSTKTEITADQMSLNADGSYTEVTSYRITAGVTVTTTQGGGLGVYTSANGAVSFRQTTPSAATFSGSVSGNTMTVILGAATFVYGR